MISWINKVMEWGVFLLCINYISLLRLNNAVHGIEFSIWLHSFNYCPLDSRYACLVLSNFVSVPFSMMLCGLRVLIWKLLYAVIPTYVSSLSPHVTVAWHTTSFARHSPSRGHIVLLGQLHFLSSSVWKILCRAPHYSNITKRCNLCMAEKFRVLC